MKRIKRIVDKIGMRIKRIVYLFLPTSVVFKFHSMPGFYEHKCNHRIYCQPCLDKNIIMSELSRINPSGYLCRICGEVYDITNLTFIWSADELEELEEMAKAIIKYDKDIKSR